VGSVYALLTRYAEDPAIRVVVVAGGGSKAFMSGADISKFESERANMEAQQRYDAIASRRAFMEKRKPNFQGK
jgi:enoyl-CoA hydratase/carnithine racemase